MVLTSFHINSKIMVPSASGRPSPKLHLLLYQHWEGPRRRRLITTDQTRAQENRGSNGPIWACKAEPNALNTFSGSVLWQGGLPGGGHWSPSKYHQEIAELEKAEWQMGRCAVTPGKGNRTHLLARSLSFLHWNGWLACVPSLFSLLSQHCSWQCFLILGQMAAAAIVASVAALSPSSFGRSSWQDRLTRSIGTQ